jgi:O-antigen/teichoic acid export membrane protein
MAVDFLLGAVGGLAASVAIAHALGPAKVGYYSYLLWAVSSVAAAAGLGVPAATRKYAAEFFGAGDTRAALDIVDRTWNIQRVFATSAALGSLAVVAFFVPGQHRIYAVLAALCVVPTMLLEIPTAAAAAAQRYQAFVVPSIIGAALNLSGVALSLVFRWDLAGLSASLFTARCVDLWLRRRAFARIAVRRAGQPAALTGTNRNPCLTRRIRRFCAGSAAVQLLSLIVWDRSEVFFLGRFCDARQVAFYAMPFNMISQALLTTRGFASSAGAHLMNKVGSDRVAARCLTAVMLRYVAMIALPLLLGLAALSRPLVTLLYGIDFQPAAAILAVLATFAVARAAITPVLHVFSAFEMQGRALAVMTFCAAANLLLDWFLIPVRGALGAAFANGLSQCAGICALWLVLAREMRIHLQWRGMLPIAGAAIGAVTPAAAIALALPPWPALLIGVTAGVILYPTLLRALKAIDPADLERFTSLVLLVPVLLQPPTLRLIAWLAPESASRARSTCR